MAVRLRSNANFLRNIARAEGVAQKQLNDVFREGARLAGQWWIDNCLMRHFQPGAHQRYNYRNRRSDWQQIKARARIIDDPVTGKKSHATQPPTDLIWTGELRDDLAMRKGSFQAQATAKFASKSSRQQVTCIVKIPLIHPINRVNSGEITRIAPDEQRAMRRILFNYARPRIVKLMRAMLSGGR